MFLCSIHPSLHISPYKKKRRSVLTRAEKIKKLEKEGKWKEGDSLFHLSKVKVASPFRVRKEKEEIKPVVKGEVPELVRPKHKKESKDIGKIK